MEFEIILEVSVAEVALFESVLMAIKGGSGMLESAYLVIHVYDRIIACS